MRGMRQKKKKAMKALAKKHICNYFELAHSIYSKDLSRAHGYVQDALKISLRTKITIPKPYKRQYCPHCKHFLVPSVNARIRLHRKKMVYLCQDCKHFKRIPIKR